MVTWFDCFNKNTVFQRGCTVLHSQQWCMRAPLSPRSQQHLLLPVVFRIAFLVAIKWDLVCGLVYISSMTNNVQHLFICLLAICVSFLENYVFRSFAHF